MNNYTRHLTYKGYTFAVRDENTTIDIRRSNGCPVDWVYASSFKSVLALAKQIVNEDIVARSK
jgi:hypothetical protein